MSKSSVSARPSVREPARGRRRGGAVRALAASAALLCVAGYVVAQYAVSHVARPHCTVRAPADGEGGARYEVLPKQAANAATIEAVASARDLPERAVTIALATAMQESGLRNIDYGDRDSLGLFQQRPSQGWGTPEQILDPVYAAGKFYDRLVEVPDYTRLPLTVAAQKVQRSAYPRAYAKHEVNAELLAAALTGRHAAALNCTVETRAEPAEAADPQAVRRKLRRQFGEGVLASGGQDGETLAARAGGGRSKPSSHMVLPVPTARRGWELAHWSVAKAAGLGIERITYDGRVWSAERSREGWRVTTRDSPPGTGGAVVLKLATGT